MPRPPEVSAGLLVFRRKPVVEVLLAHPGGPFWAKKDAGVWTIPKGLAEPGDELLRTAQREFLEETGLMIEPGLAAFLALAPVRQKSGKLVHAFAVEADLDLAGFASNDFEIEWPPKSGRRQRFPEVDRVAWFGFDEAMRKILRYQRPFLVELRERTNGAVRR